MSTMRFAGPLFVGAMLSGCGTYVPPIQDFGDAVEGQRFVQAIVTNVTCEMQDAVHHVYTRYKSTFMDGWGVQMTLSLTVNEKGSLNPTVNWLPPSPATALFNLSAGGTVSADATRINKLNAYHLIQDLRRTACPEENRPGGLFLMQSDLKLKEWLYDAITAQRTESVDFSVIRPDIKTNVISHDVKFEIVTSGSVTPTWRLTRVTVNPTGSLLSANRGRTHQLILTFGPADNALVQQIVRGRQKTVVVVQPARQAADLHLSSIIGAAVAEGVRGALR